MTLSELGKNVRDTSTSTISRCLKSLSNCRLVKKNGGKYELTGIGYLVADYFSNIEQILSLWELLHDSGEFMRVLPIELKPGLAYLCNAEVEPDPYAAVMKAVEDLKKAKKYGKYIDRIVSYEVFQIMWLKELEGVRDYVIIPNNEDIIRRKSEVAAQSLKDLGLSSDELEYIIHNFGEVRLMDTPFQLGIIDGEVVYLQMFQREKTETPVFISRDKKCVEWGEKVFDYFWELAEPFDSAAEIRKYLIMD
jgi:predicted transcriptional regulator